MPKKTKLNNKVKLVLTEESSKKSSNIKAPKKSKSAGKSGGTTQGKKKPVSLDPLREQLGVLTTEANRRYWEQQERGVASRAAMEAERSLTKSHKEKYFDTNNEMFTANLRTRAEINREFARTMAFLSDYTSQATENEYFGFEYGSAQGLFGGQWRKNGGPGYDEERVSKEDADMVFDIYHRVIEAGGGWDRVIGYFRMMSPGLVDYGSENLINAIYDMVSHKGAIGAVMGVEDVTGVILNRALDLLDSMREMYDEMAANQRAGYDYGNIEDDPKAAEYRRRNFAWRMYREDLKNGNR